MFAPRPPVTWERELLAVRLRPDTLSLESPLMQATHRGFEIADEARRQEIIGEMAIEHAFRRRGEG